MYLSPETAKKICNDSDMNMELEKIGKARQGVHELLTRKVNKKLPGKKTTDILDNVTSLIQCNHTITLRSINIT